MKVNKSNYKNQLYSLIPLEDFKALTGFDDREDKTARFCLLTATLTIEQFCKRKFLRKKYTEVFQLNGDLLVPLKEYPVNEILQVSSEKMRTVGSAENNGDRDKSKCESFLIDPVFYRPMFGSGYNEELPFELLLSPSLRPYGFTFLKVIYWSGYAKEKREGRNEKSGISVPSDLSAACLELASWNMNRYRGKRIGMTGNIRGAGVRGTRADGEHFELSMPENVRTLLEPYKRKLI